MKAELRAAFEKPKDSADSGLKKPVLKKRIQETMAAAATVLCLVLAASSVWGERIEVGSSFNPVGSGARALGMGGAFIGVADDATAASWNPGGLTQLDEPEISYVYGYTHRIEDTDIGNHPEAVGSESFSPSNLNYLSFAYPFELGETKRPMTISLNYQKMYDFTHGWNYTQNKSSEVYEQKGSLYALGLAYSVDLSMNFAFGFTVNYWGDFIIENQWKQKYTTIREGWGTLIKEEKYNFDRWNFHLGFLWKISEQLRLGGVFKTPFFIGHIERSVTRKEELTEEERTGREIPSASPPLFYKDKLHMPMSYGIGLAYRWSDTITFAADIYRTHWEDFELEDEDGNKFSPLSGKKISESDIDTTTWLRIGAERVFIIKKYNLLLSLRGGIFYDPPPSEQKSDDYYGASIGLGFVFNSISLDFAYQFRFGNRLATTMPENFSQDVDEHTVYTSLIFYF